MRPSKEQADDPEDSGRQPRAANRSEKGDDAKPGGFRRSPLMSVRRTRVCEESSSGAPIPPGSGHRVSPGPRAGECTGRAHRLRRRRTEPGGCGSPDACSPGTAGLGAQRLSRAVPGGPHDRVGWHGRDHQGRPRPIAGRRQRPDSGHAGVSVVTDGRGPGAAAQTGHRVHRLRRGNARTRPCGQPGLHRAAATGTHLARPGQVPGLRALFDSRLPDRRTGDGDLRRRDGDDDREESGGGFDGSQSAAQSRSGS